jgi:hypothetical protein
MVNTGLNISALASTSVSQSSSSFTGYLDYRYDHVCTNFHHNARETTFSGDRALLTGSIYGVSWSSGSLLGSTSVGPCPPLTMTVISGVYDTVGSTGYAYLLGGISTFPFVSDFAGSNIYSTLSAAMSFNMTNLGLSGVSGNIFAEFAAGGASTYVTSAFGQFSLARGGICNV